jgi:TPP-dependent pyruvate/acetoin dehydrogenase alpha subunit
LSIGQKSGSRLTHMDMGGQASLSRAELMRGYQTMLLTRHLEQQLVDYYLKNKVFSFVHFYIGQEAVAAGVCNALRPEDGAMGNHRSHGHYLAKGGDPLRLVAEMLGRHSGCCRGKGGSMHMIDKSVNFWGSTPILGSVSALATGTALAAKLQKRPTVTAVFFGDGASEEGVVYESVNFAAKFELPIVYVIENNLYSVNSKLTDRRSPNHSQELLAKGLGVRYVRADGNDYVDVYRKAKEAVSFARDGSPVVLECITYRHMAHSAPLFDDKAGYREIDTLEERERQDPLKKLKALLAVDEESARELEALEQATIERCKQTVERASQEPYPETSEMMKDVYA